VFAAVETDVEAAEDSCRTAGGGAVKSFEKTKVEVSSAASDSSYEKRKLVEQLHFFNPNEVFIEELEGFDEGEAAAVTARDAEGDC
jgi:hypothetical protein